MNNTRYTIECTEEQLRAITTACEVVARIKIGQIDMAIEHWPIGKDNKRLSYDDVKLIESILKHAIGLDLNVSYGVGYSEKADLLFDLNEVFRNRLAWDKAIADGVTDGIKRDFKNMVEVYYDEPMHWNKTVPLATVVKKVHE